MEDDVKRIRTNWSAAVAASDIVGNIFYQNLFRIAPETRSMFSEDLDTQGRKLVQTLSWIVDHLEDPDDLVPAAEALSRRHVGYGVEPSHYDSVGKALIETLRQGLGTSFSDADAAAWARTYASLCNIMIGAAYPEEA